MNPWAALMLVTGGLFAGSVVAFAWDRVSAWKAMPVQQYMSDFGHTIHRADKIQPALLVVAIATAATYGFRATGSAQTFALAGAGGFLAVMLASLGILVPLQRRILRTPVESSDAVHQMQQRWFTGHVGRAVLSTVSFTLVVAGAAVGLDS